MPRKWWTERKSFGSRSIALRPHPSHGGLPSTKARKAKGPFRLFDLPPEIRIQVLSLSLQDCQERAQVIKIFLASRRIYQEAADIFYHDTWIDMSSHQPKPPGLLAEPMNPLSPRLYVRTMNLTIHLKTSLRAFNEACIPVLREMADKGTLRTLHLEISDGSSGIDFWTDESSENNNNNDFRDTEIVLRLGPEDKKKKYKAPAFLAAQPFQTFLEFLSDPQIPKVALYIASRDHCEFWCHFHRRRSPEGIIPCSHRSWPGKASRLKVNQKHLVRFLRGARPLRASTNTGTSSTRHVSTTTTANMASSTRSLVEVVDI